MLALIEGNITRTLNAYYQVRDKKMTSISLKVVLVEKKRLLEKRRQRSRISNTNRIHSQIRKIDYGQG